MFFSFFLMFLKVFQKVPLPIENSKLRLALVIPIDASKTVAIEEIETPQLFAEKTNNVLSK